jgi:hypothetical protein
MIYNIVLVKKRRSRSSREAANIPQDELTVSCFEIEIFAP